MKRQFLLVLMLGVLLSGCGSSSSSPSTSPSPSPSLSLSPSLSPTPTPTPTPSSVTSYTANIPSTGSLDGHVMSDSAMTNSVYSYTGDYGTSGPPASNTAFKTVVSFSLSFIPSSATITSATLRVYQVEGCIGTDPYTIYGGVKVDHVTYSSVTSALYSSAALSTFTPYLAQGPVTQGYKELDVTTAVQNDHANSRTRSQYRLYHEDYLGTETTDNGEDSCFWLMAECLSDSNTPDNPPQLVVEYSI